MKNLIGTGAVAALTVGVVVIGPAASAEPLNQDNSTPAVQTTGSITVVDRGGDNDSGWVEYTGTGTITIDDTTGARKYAEVGGGEWRYGTWITTQGKHCYSSYRHPTETATATAVMGDRTSHAVSDKPGISANASVDGWTTATCKAYWGKE